MEKKTTRCLADADADADADEEVSLREQRPCIYITEVVLRPRSFWLPGIIQSWHSTDASSSREQKSYDGSLRGLEIPQLEKV